MLLNNRIKNITKLKINLGLMSKDDGYLGGNNLISHEQIDRNSKLGLK